jgi:hypothetical protein
MPQGTLAAALQMRPCSIFFSLCSSVPGAGGLKAMRRQGTSCWQKHTRSPEHVYTALHCTVLYCTVLYCTVLYCMQPTVGGTVKMFTAISSAFYYN